MNLKSKQLLDYYLGGALLFLMKPLVALAGMMLRRNHDFQVGQRLVCIKLQGGGSLLLAFPALLAIRKEFADRQMLLVTTSSVAPFARSLGLFDSLIVIDDHSLLRLLYSGIKAVAQCVGCDTVVDFEVYSRLSTIFSLATLARNRIGFYLANVFWRKGVYTHLVFFNPFSGSYLFYEQIARLFNLKPIEIAKCREHLSAVLQLPPPREASVRKIAIGHGCSELGPERMLSAAQWQQVFARRIQAAAAASVVFLGSRADADLADQISVLVSKSHPELNIVNFCGQLSLEDSLKELAAADEFWGIDSALLHYARILGLRCVSYWGPTMPASRLKDFAGLEEEIFYHKLSCSPCIHVSEASPCGGNNLCIALHFDSRIYQAYLKGEVGVPILCSRSEGAGYLTDIPINS